MAENYIEIIAQFTYPDITPASYVYIKRRHYPGRYSLFSKHSYHSPMESYIGKTAELKIKYGAK